MKTLATLILIKKPFHTKQPMTLFFGCWIELSQHMCHAVARKRYHAATPAG